jgi:nucleotide-binding universal stress UspA family protein
VFDRILFPTDGSDGAADVLGHVIDLAGRHDAELHLLNVVNTAADSVIRVQADVVDVLKKKVRRSSPKRPTGLGAPGSKP